jgi:sigma-B regulation protein RsbU (phosphoserine phosphatase)
MKRIFGLILLSLLCVCALPAQTFNIDSGREPIASLDGLWRFHTGDNAAWANPNFDDSHWQLLRTDKSWTEQGFPNYGGYAWYRFTIHVADGSKPFALLLTPMNTGYQVYANGSLVGSAGSTTPTGDPVYALLPQSFTIPIGNAGPQTITIALRVWNYKPGASWFGGGSLSLGNAVGDPALVTQMRNWYVQGSSLAYVNSYTFGLLSALIGITIFGLFLFRREDREYLWFSVLLLAGAADAALYLWLNLGSFPFTLYYLLKDIADGLVVIAALAFFATVLHVRRSVFWWTACIAATVSPLTVALYSFQWTGVGIYEVVWLCCLLPAYAWILTALTVGAVKKDTSARLLLVPAVLLYGYNFIDSLLFISWQLGWQVNPGALEVPLIESPFPLYPRDIINFIFILALLIFLVRRFSLARQKEARLSTEMEAARGVQQFVVPATPASTPGFEVESIYLPDSEVGGDFFQILPGDDGSILIVMGDVSGKGLKAAMTVSTIIGALRGCGIREPAKVLANLNRVLHGQISGFATCVAARISASGAMTIANAGHIPPYRNGEELAVPGGLPLGIIAACDYEETEFEVAVGDRLTFVSDGVVEATDEKHELFGFARTQAISRQSAQAIAAAAKQFGQEDDISVLSVTRTEMMKAELA